MNRVLGVLFGVALAGQAVAGEVRFAADGHAYNPIFSKDGKWLAYEVNSYDGGSIDMFVSSVAGAIAKDGTKVALAGASQFSSSGQILINPTWHPGGLAIFEGSNQGGDYRLYIYQPGGGSPTELLNTTKAPGNLTFPIVTNDGNTLAYVSSQTGNGDIRSWDRTKDTFGQITTSDHSESFPTYSGDNKTLLFNRNSGGTEDIFLLDLATKAEKAFVTGGGDQTRSVFAAGGTVLYFSNERGQDAWDVMAVDGAGENKRVVAKDVRLPLRSRPTLTPDGQWVAWTSNKAELSGKVYLGKVDGSKTVEIDTGYNGCGEPALTVNGGRTIIAFTYLQNNGADWRKLDVLDVTDKLQ
jgi:Tol biopolymer transport system component